MAQNGQIERILEVGSDELCEYITFPQANLFLPFLIAAYSAISLDISRFPSGDRSGCCYFGSSFTCSLPSTIPIQIGSLTEKQAFFLLNLL